MILREKMREICRTIKEWPLAVKIIIPVCIVVVIAGVTIVTLLAGNHTQEVLPTEREDGTEQVSEVEQETQQPETETQAQQVMETIPVMTPCNIQTESLEKNLDIYFTDEEGNLIAEVPFAVKLFPNDENGKMIQSVPSDSAEGSEVLESDPLPADQSLEEIIEVINDLNQQQAELEEQMGSTDFPVNEYEEILVQKKYAANQYRTMMELAEGTLYEDDDRDGAIHADNIAGGKYTLCFIPVENPKTEALLSSVTPEEEEPGEVPSYFYDTKEYFSEVTVKGQTDYDVLEFVDRKTVDAELAGDTEETDTDIAQKARREDTVGYVDEFSIEQTSDYKRLNRKASELNIKAAASSELEETSSTVQQTAESETEAEQTGQEAAQTTVQSKLSINKSIVLYANSDPKFNTVTLNCEVTQVSEPQMTVSAELADVLQVRKEGEAYILTVQGPNKIESNLSGEVILAGKDAAGKEIQVKGSVTIYGRSSTLSYKKQKLYIENKKKKMVRATVGNYSSNQIYYVEEKSTTTSYYGWQTKGKKRYYYDKNGQLVKGKQRIGGIEYTFDKSNGKLLRAAGGINVSSWQGEIDWTIASSSLNFAMIRGGFRGTTGKLAADRKYILNVNEARKNKIKVGMYFHSRATSPAQAVEEASLAVSLAKSSGNLDLPVYIELDSSVHGSMSTEQRTAIAYAFCMTVQKGGYKAGVMASLKEWKKSLDAAKLSGYSIWCQEYDVTCSYKNTSIWQYTNKGRVPGIVGEVCLNEWMR